MMPRDVKRWNQEELKAAGKWEVRKKRACARVTPRFLADWGMEVVPGTVLRNAELLGQKRGQFSLGQVVPEVPLNFQAEMPVDCWL